MRRFLKALDNVSKWTGKGGSWLILALVFGIGYEVLMRYGFANPTFWAYDMTWMMYGVYIMLGTAWCHFLGGHVRMDLLYSRLSPRRKAIVEVVCYFVLFFPLLYVLLRYCGAHTIWSWSIGESSSASTWRPPVYPFKTLVVVSFALLALQGISQFIKSLFVLVTRKSYES